jgi:hypothetical protein
MVHGSADPADACGDDVPPASPDAVGDALTHPLTADNSTITTMLAAARRCGELFISIND